MAVSGTWEPGSETVYYGILWNKSIVYLTLIVYYNILIYLKSRFSEVDLSHCA